MKRLYTFLLLAFGSLQFAWAQTPVLNSNPSSVYVLMLDLDGYTDNSGWWSNWPIPAASSGYSSAQMTEVFNRVSEDFRPFDLNVTTSEAVFAATPVANRQRVVLTPTDTFYNKNGTSAGGVAYIGVFGAGDIPCWVFTNKMGGSAANSAEAASHELGHTLGLSHHARYNSDCSLNTGYHNGQGSGQTAWAPIMGVGYGKTITQWYNGAANGSTCSSYYQDDFKVISTTNGFGFRTDDVGNTNATATNLTLVGNSVSTTGIISNNTDVDVYKFTVSQAGSFSFAVAPYAHNSSSFSGANLDAKLSVRNAAGLLLAESQPLSTLSASLSLVLSSGDYFVSIDGAGIANYIAIGGLGPEDYGSVGQYTLTASIPTCTTALTSVTSGERCGTGTLTLAATASTGTISWFAASTGGTALGTGTSFVTPSISTSSTYFVEVNNGTCSSSRIGVNAVVSTAPVLQPISGGSTVQAGFALQLSEVSPGGIWSTSDVLLASVSGTGLVSALAAGSVTISYTASSGSCPASSVSKVITITGPQPCSGVPTVTDVDGNVYNTVQIGTQCWTKENLRTSKYADNSSIASVPLDANWVNLSTGAWANYGNNANLNDTYGKLYNGFAVADARKLCPTGWHVPSQTELSNLTNFLGGIAFTGGKLKQASTLWQQPNVLASNYSGFSALPGGQRAATGPFTNVGTTAAFWSQTFSGSTGLSYSVFNDTEAYSSGNTDRKSGYAVRCVQDIAGSGPKILQTIPGSRCGTGTVILTAYATEGATVNWYAGFQGGNMLGTGNSFTTPSISVSTTFYCEAVSGVIGGGTSSGRTAVLATVNPLFDAGTLASGDQIICNAGDPAAISFATVPSGADFYAYQWYYQDGLAACPSGAGTTGWTLISQATASSYDPPSGLTASRTYAVFVTPTNQGRAVCGTAAWATACRKVSVLPAVNVGTLASANQSLNAPADPAPISFSSFPSGGSGTFGFQWYYQDGLAIAPSGSSVVGWTLIASATANTYDPPSGLAASRSYACFVSPGGSPLCGSAAWASGVQQVTVIQVSPIVPGVLTAGNQTICYAGDPANITFSTAPSGPANYTRQWYYQDGIVAAPSGSAATGWTLISGAIGASYDPPAQLLASRTYACLISATGTTSAWASGARQVTVLPLFNPGTITSGDQTFCNSGNPGNITLSVNPSGSGAYRWKWYYRENSTGNCPSGSTPPTGWLTNTTSPNITGTTTTGAGISFDPISAGTVGKGRTFGVLITPLVNGAIPACGTPQFANSCRRLYVNACLKPGSVSAESMDIPVQFSVFPNPVFDQFTLLATGLHADENLEVQAFDAKGRSVLHQTFASGTEEKKLSASNWTSGIYLLVIHTANGVWTERVVK